VLVVLLSTVVQALVVFVSITDQLLLILILTTAHADTFTEPTEAVNCIPTKSTALPIPTFPAVIFADTPVTTTSKSIIILTLLTVDRNKFVLTLTLAFAVIDSLPESACNSSVRALTFASIFNETVLRVD